MVGQEATFREGNFKSVPIRDLGLAIAGSPLEPLLLQVSAEVEQSGFRHLRPHYYLSTEWGVPFPSVSIAIPFYLARTELTRYHAGQTAHVEGMTAADILRYLRHEMGHVVNYAYQLYEDPEWVRQFGSIKAPYHEEYRPEPFSRRFTCHLPGWYAQKHPDEDWAETFAVWLTPGRDWSSDYASWPAALSKLRLCNELVARVKDQEPLVTTKELHDDVEQIGLTIEQFYSAGPNNIEQMPALDNALRSIFGSQPDKSRGSSGAALIQQLEQDLIARVFEWTGHFPERTRGLLRSLTDRARQLQLSYPVNEETAVTVGLTTLVTTLAMNYTHRGSYEL